MYRPNYISGPCSARILERENINYLANSLGARLGWYKEGKWMGIGGQEAAESI